MVLSWASSLGEGTPCSATHIFSYSFQTRLLVFCGGSHLLGKSFEMHKTTKILQHLWSNTCFFPHLSFLQNLYESPNISWNVCQTPCTLFSYLFAHSSYCSILYTRSWGTPHSWKDCRNMVSMSVSLVDRHIYWSELYFNGKWTYFHFVFTASSMSEEYCHPDRRVNNGGIMLNTATCPACCSCRCLLSITHRSQRQIECGIGLLKPLGWDVIRRGENFMHKTYDCDL